MRRPGDNLPEFRSVQLDFAAHIRNPELNPKPSDVEARRMQIYVDLFFRNIKSFLDSAFPVARKVVGEQQWRALAREFVHRHGSQAPYFLQISEEFLTFLDDRGLQDLPPFLLELCHYEWVELALDVAPDNEFVDDDADADEIIPQGKLLVSPLVRALVYLYPVHKITEQYQPQKSPEIPTYLLVYRTPELNVRFMESNPLTHRLLALLEEVAVAQAFDQLGAELAEAGRNVPMDALQKQGKDIIARFIEAGIIRSVQNMDE